ncbi:MAG: hypothetical protein KDD69_18460, partial [Bdellovibrionales bacterium]|nr:hypothetical protein [Bdellovibrionales bacterium]
MATTVAALVLVAHFSIALVREHRQLEDSLALRAKTTGSSLAIAVAEPVWNLDTQLANQCLLSAMVDPEVIGASIIDDRAGLFASLQPERYARAQ